MMQRLRATTKRVQRSVARVERMAGVCGNATGSMATFAWNAKPWVPATAICTFGKYHTRRLQEMRT